MCVLKGNQAVCSKGYGLSEGQGGLPDDRVYHQPGSGEERSEKPSQMLFRINLESLLQNGD